jgi:predicted TIM-barrel fold metal-dependent hydrolase
MDRYKVDMSVVNSVTGYWMRNEIIAKMLERNPDRLVAFCAPADAIHGAITGELKEPLTGDLMVEELEKWLRKPGFVGIGEHVLSLPGLNNNLPPHADTWEKILPHQRKVLDLCVKYKVPILMGGVGYTGRYLWGTSSTLRFCDPLYFSDLAIEYPEVPIILWMDGGNTWYTHMWERTMMVVGSHDNVYVVPCWESKFIEKAYIHPNVGPDKMCWGSDFGASYTYKRLEDGRTYAIWTKPPMELAYHVEWSLEQINRVNMPGEDRAKILGLNAARLCKVDVKRKLLEQEKKYGSEEWLKAKGFKK